MATPSRVLKILGAERANNLIESWQEHLAKGDIVVCLDEHGFDRRLAKKILVLWGAEAATRIRENPYRMMALAEWPVVDAAARKIGMALDAPERCIAAVEAVLYKRYRAGHTWMAATALRVESSRLLGTRSAPDAIALALDAGAIFQSGSGYQPAGAIVMERYVTDRIALMIKEASARAPIDRKDDAAFEYWAKGDTAARHLDENQLDAVRLGLHASFGLIMGGAGVCKTSTLRVLCKACGHAGIEVHLMALAGRAAARLREATGKPASTIAAFTGRVEKHETAIADGALIVIDEASMIDLPTFYRLLRCLPESIRMILVGDPAQLPPIGFGLVPHALKEQPYIPQVELKIVYRQADETGIPTVAGAIRIGNLPSLPAAIGEDRSGVVLIPRSDPLQTEDIVDIVTELDGFGEDLRILSAVKAGPVGIDALNARFHTIMAAGKPTWHGFAVGDPVMFLRNDYRRDLRNGSLGEVKAIEDELLLAVFDGNEHLFQRKDLGDLMLAYAITVHKAQGSQFRRIVMPIVPSRLLDRSLIYTAVTRAIDLAVMIGSQSVLGPAITREQSADRRQIGITGVFD